MKKYTKIRISFLISLVTVFILFYISFLAPYNLSELINGRNLMTIPEVSGYFSGFNAHEVKYLGSNTFKVITEKGDFIVIPDYTDQALWKYKIFKYETELKYFSNPM